MARPGEQNMSLNCPEENDEFESEHLHNTRTTEEQQIILHHDTVSYNPIPHHPSAAHGHQTSWDQTVRVNHTGWQFSTNCSLGQRAGSSHSLPSCLPSVVYQTISDGCLFYPSRPHSLPGSSSLMSLEHPKSLHSAQNYPHPSCSYPSPYLHPPCCGQFSPPRPHAAAVHHCRPHLPSRPSGPAHYRQMHPHISEHSDASRKTQQAEINITYLSHQQRKVFVTYEADSEEHVKEIITFVALLRNNGFHAHMDVFERQLSSISKIDCMEKYLNEKDYLIIIIISLRYYETVTGCNIHHERTTDTVYIHRQLQNEFIQNGCRNYRFIPVLFPGANKSCVPAWLQNTHIYSWPRDRDDILRRLMRLEKYQPPSVGSLPTIVSVPL